MSFDLFSVLLAFVFVSAPFTFISLFYVTAPYGRYSRKGWGPDMDTRIAWVAMEAPSAIVIVICFLVGPRRFDLVPLLLLGMWELHYIDRSFFYPLRMRAGRRQTPIAMIASGALYNCINGYLNGTSLTSAGPIYDSSWLADPRFLVGAAMFFGGFAINRWADTTLANLRKPGETGYKIPRGGLYQLISCPNYFGEVLEWTGWAIATWSLAGLSFAVFTAANLLPRAVANHRWYQEQFPDYPAQRRAVIPFLW